MTSDTILKTSFGPKEGRLPPGSLFSPVSAEHRRRSPSRRKNACLFGLVLLVFLVYSAYVQPSLFERLEPSGISSRYGAPLPGTNSLVSPGGTRVKDNQTSKFSSRKNVQPSAPQKPMKDSIAKDEETPKESETDKTATGTGVPKKQNYHQKNKGGYEGQKSYSSYWPERSRLRHDLEQVFSLMPDEMNTRELLRPINNGGPERMRELGLRTRTYQRYLNAWEKLHIVEDEKTGETYIRDDLVQYLRGMQDDEDTGADSSLTNIIHNYDAFRSFMTKFSHVLFPFTAPYFADHMTLHAQFKKAGRGIVLTAGDDQAQYLLTTIYTYRELGCDLPIEIMYLGDTDLGEDHRLELEALPGVTTRDISQMVDDSGWKLAGWAIKPFAMLMSSFREVIFIDADSFFLKDPTRLFDDPDYKKTGALFFRDRTIMPESKRRWLLQILPRPIHKLAKESSWWTGTSGHHQESGVVVVDKWKHFVSMLLVCRFNGSDRDPRDGKVGVYEMMHGDKETFWIGFLLAGDPSFAFHSGAVGSIGVLEPVNAAATGDAVSNDNEKVSSVDPGAEEGESPALEKRESEEPETYKICSPQLLHMDTDGTPLWFNGWLLVSKYADRSKRRFAPMTAYMREPRHKAVDDDFWELTTDNMCCLTAPAADKSDLSEHDLGLLKMMRDRASEVGIMN